MIAPIFGKMAEDVPEVEFVKVDVDEAQDIAAMCGISAMPTFQVYRDGAKVEEMRGADPKGLANMVNKHK